VILKNSLAIPKLLYLLRTSQCRDNPLLRQFDDTLRTGLININNDQWLQASLPLGDCGLGMRNAEMLAPSAYLASSASTLLLQQSILPDSIWMQGDQSVASTETPVQLTKILSANTTHLKAWDRPVAIYQKNLILSRAPSDVDKARLLAAASPHSGDWLHAPPITAVGLRLSDEAIRVAVARRLGTKAYEPRTCLCGMAVDARGLYGLSFCRTGRSAPRQQRHCHLNDILWRAIKRVQMPAVKESVSHAQTGPLSCHGPEESLAWDVSILDTYAESHVGSTFN